jgi:hypothetical protein
MIILNFGVCIKEIKKEKEKRGNPKVFCDDKESMIEMVEISTSKKLWKHILITSELYGRKKGDLTTKQVANMHKEWQYIIKEILDEKDAAFVINQGNVCALIHESNLEEFRLLVQNIQVESSKLDSGIRANVTELSYGETALLLKIN